MTGSKIVTHAKHAKKSHETATQSEEAMPSPTNEDTTPQPVTTNFTAAAKTAVSLISEAQNVLPLTEGLGEKARKSAIRLQVIPSDLLTEAASFLVANGDQYPMFDVKLAQDAAETKRR